jgi:WD40 repeat protein
VWSVACSSDGRFLISGGGDQTVRIWNLVSYELIATLLQGRDEEWVMWTPQGYYTGSPGADKLVGWQINHEPTRPLTSSGSEQLRRHLNRPRHR